MRGAPKVGVQVVVGGRGLVSRVPTNGRVRPKSLERPVTRLGVDVLFFLDGRVVKPCAKFCATNDGKIGDMFSKA